jgi:capsular polysaccharide export protein
MARVIVEVAESFARHAPQDAVLLVKNHPLDNGVVDRARLVRGIAARTGLGPRLRFLDGGRLPALLERVSGVVVVNSTVGLQAIHHGRPTRVLGRALYDLPGLADPQALAGFWRRPAPPDPILYRAFRTVLLAETQLNGSFYTHPGRALLLPAATARLTRADVLRHPAARAAPDDAAAARAARPVHPALAGH